MKQDQTSQEGTGGSTADHKVEELNQIRKAIFDRARHTVDPDGTGFDANLLTDDGSFFFGPTEEEQFKDWLDWGERFISTISLVSQRVSLAVISAGFAMAGSTMMANERTATFGQVSLAGAGILAVWFVAANIMSAKSGR